MIHSGIHKPRRDKGAWIFAAGERTDEIYFLCVVDLEPFLNHLYRAGNNPDNPGRRMSYWGAAGYYHMRRNMMRMMRKATGAAMALAFAASALIGTGGAASAKVGPTSGTFALVSRYVWRGQDLLQNNDAAFQPSVTFSLKNSLSLNVWGSVGKGGPNDANELDELDFTLSKSGALNDAVNWTFGHTYYTFHTAGNDESQETFAGLSLPKAAMKPSVTLYGDWGGDVSKGYYLNVAGGHDIPLAGNKRVPSITMNVSAGYCDGQWSMKPGLSDVNVSLAAPIALEGFTVTPFVTYTYVPDKASSAKGQTSPPFINTQNEIWGGVNFDVKF